MDRRRLDKLHLALAAAWKSPQTAGDLQALAKLAGRIERSGSKHGSMWITEHFPHRPFPIPTHGNRDISIGVRKVVLTALEADAAAWEEALDDEAE